MPDREGLEFVIRQSATTNARANGQASEMLSLRKVSVLDEIKRAAWSIELENNDRLLRAMCKVESEEPTISHLGFCEGILAFGGPGLLGVGAAIQTISARFSK